MAFTIPLIGLWTTGGSENGTSGPMHMCFVSESSAVLLTRFEASMSTHTPCLMLTSVTQLIFSFKL